MSEAHIGKSTTLKSFLNIGGRVVLMCVAFKLNREQEFQGLNIQEKSIVVENTCYG